MDATKEMDSSIFYVGRCVLNGIFLPYFKEFFCCIYLKWSLQ